MKPIYIKILFGVIVGLAVLIGLSIFNGSPVINDGHVETDDMETASLGDQFPRLTANNTLFIDVKSGIVKIQLLPDVAPKHVARIKELAKEGFYDGIIFHRVIDGFMAQTGDPSGTGRGGSDKPNVAAEFTDKYSFKRGMVGMARSQLPDSANSQFFIMLADGAFLDGNYTIWGRVVDGMNAVDNIAKGEPPASPDKMLRVYLNQ